jgi:hypothetical protein
MKEKSKNMDLEIISVTSNDAVPAAEVEQSKKKKGWTLFRSSKSKSEENAKKEISTDGDPTNVKIISVKPKNEESNEDDEKENLEEIQIVEIKKTDDEKGNTEEIDESMKTEEVVVPKRRWYQWFGRRSQKKNKKPEEIPVTDTLIEKNEAPLAEQDDTKGTESNEIEVVETLPANAEPSDKDDVTPVETPTGEPEKRKRLTLNFFRRSTKKNKNAEKVSPTETIIEEIEIKTDEEIKTETTDDNKAESPEIVESETLAKDVAKDTPTDESKDDDTTVDKPNDNDAIVDKPKEGSSTDDKSEQPEDAATADVKRKRFTLRMFFRRSTKKNEKSPEEVPNTETLPGDDKVAEINEIGPEPEKIEEKGTAGDEKGTAENVKEVPIEEPKIECSDKNEGSCDIEVVKDEKLQNEVVKDEKLQTEDVPSDNQAEKSELPIGDNTNVGDVQNTDGPNNDENLPIDDNAEKSVQLNAETPMKEVEQK